MWYSYCNTMPMEWGLFLLLYLVSVPVFLLIDMIWLGYLARGLYQRELGPLLGDVRWGAAIGFYLIYLVGVTFFASYPAFLDGSVVTAFLLGGLFGFFTYATYGLTNLATLKSWPTKLVFIDLMWGTALGSLVAGGTVILLGMFI